MDVIVKLLCKEKPSIALLASDLLNVSLSDCRTVETMQKSTLELYTLARILLIHCFSNGKPVLAIVALQPIIVAVELLPREPLLIANRQLLNYNYWMSSWSCGCGCGWSGWSWSGWSWSWSGTNFT